LSEEVNGTTYAEDLYPYIHDSNKAHFRTYTITERYLHHPGQKGCDKVNHPAFRKEQTKREPKLPFMFSTFGVITSLRILRH
jgi:hypothetical protein